MPGHVRYFKGTGLQGNERQFNEVAAGEHLRRVEAVRHIAEPRFPLAPGLMAQRMRNLEGK